MVQATPHHLVPGVHVLPAAHNKANLLLSDALGFVVIVIVLDGDSSSSRKLLRRLSPRTDLTSRHCESTSGKTVAKFAGTERWLRVTDDSLVGTQGKRIARAIAQCVALFYPSTYSFGLFIGSFLYLHCRTVNNKGGDTRLSRLSFVLGICQLAVPCRTRETHSL